MTRRAGLWRAAAGLYAVINIGGAAYALVMREVPHAALHVVLLVVGAAVWSRYGPGRGAFGTGPTTAQGAQPGAELTDRFRNLEQSLDAVAIEVDRIGEGQRLMTHLLVDQEDPPASGRSAPESADSDRDRSSS